ncbi:hypothetical protein M8J77_015207 [Diaphorina citri]|nr:hypothetical protein M8J77_015207 [Diaphorina citri]KAI5721043.1 hypothetical protein M8J77_015207 [Diaphorina citri]
MENPIQDLEFLDLSNINESDKHQLQLVLYAPNPNARYPELPWCGSMPVLHLVEPPPPPLDWMSQQQYGPSEDGEPLVNGTVDEEEEGLEVEEDEGGAHVYPGAPAAQAPPPASVASVPPVYPPPFSNVYVNNMTANVSVHHGYVAGGMHHPGHHGPPSFHHMPPPMYPPPPPTQQPQAVHADPGAATGGSNQKKRHKSGSNSSSSGSGGNASRRIEHQQHAPQHPQPVEIQHPAHAPMNYPFQTAGATGYYPSHIYYTGPPQHAQGGSPMYLPSPHSHHMYHPHHAGPPPPQMYPPMYPGPPPPPPVHQAMPPVTHVEETMQQQSYMQHQMDHQHHHQQGAKSSPHHHQQHHSAPHHQHGYQQPATLATNAAPAPNAAAKHQVPAPAQPQAPMEPSAHPQQQDPAQEEWQDRNGEEEHYEEEEGGEVDVGEEGCEECEASHRAPDSAPYETEVVNNTELEAYPSPADATGSDQPSPSQLPVPEHAPTPASHEIPTPADQPSGQNGKDESSIPSHFPAVTPPRNQTSASPASEVSPTPQVVTPVPEAPKTWASLLKKPDSGLASSPSAFDRKLSGSPGMGVNKPCARVEPLTSSYSPERGGAPGAQTRYGGAGAKPSGGAGGPRPANDDAASQNLGKLLLSTKLDHKGISLLPRGLINKSNYCYINATLQALVACPPFYNLLRSINKNRAGGSGPYPRSHHYNGAAAQDSAGPSSTPIFNAMLQLASEFSYLQLTPGSTGGMGRGGRDSGPPGRREDDLKCGAPFAPTYVYQILSSIKSESAFNVEGRQEDAEEFLTFLLNGLNDEMLELIKSQSPKDSSETNGGTQTKVQGGKQTSPRSTALSNGDLNNSGGDGDDGDWKEVTKESKNKGSIVRRHTSVSDKTPVSEIFRGHLRTRVHRVTDSTITENIQPFFTLPLDIEKVSSVKEALDQLVVREGLEGVTSTKTNQETEAYQTVTIEELPFVLLLHLKCFDYKSHSCHKIQKALDFPVLLSLEPRLLSSGKNKKLSGGPPNGPKNKQYKLFAVVYHDGKEASKGHYITDVFHVGYSGWIRYDDANVRFVMEQEVLHPRPPRVPYILYYRRADTIGGTASETTPSSLHSLLPTCRHYSFKKFVSKFLKTVWWLSATQGIMMTVIAGRHV